MDASLAKMAAHAAATEAKLLTAPTRIGNTLARDCETGGIAPTVTFVDSSGTSGLARGSGVKNVIFQIVHMTKVSILIHLSISQCDVYNVL